MNQGYDTDGQELFTDIASIDFLKFSIGNKCYSQQLKDAYKKTGLVCGVSCFIRYINGIKVIWMRHEFSFIGGTLGCAEGEKLCRGFEHAICERLPVIVEVRSGGARMQEGTLSLMQMAKVSVAVRAFKSRHLPFITVFQDPTYGGTSASYAMQSDIRIGISGARIGFAGENVILNTVYMMNQEAYDKACPKGFQSTSFLYEKGQLDMVVEQEQLDDKIYNILNILLAKNKGIMLGEIQEINKIPKINREFNYNSSRKEDRIQCDDILYKIFDNFIELKGDGKIGSDKCLIGGLALFNKFPVMVLATKKGHDANQMQDSNFGMASPAGYRTACRLMSLAEQFGLPVITLVDTPGAYPSFESEIEGQHEAIATSLLKMASLKVPIITIMVGEGGSGGALGFAMGDRIAMLSGGYYGVITPEGAASILCRYKSEQEKMEKFKKDCQDIAMKQGIFCEDLKRLGVIDEIIYEDETETNTECPYVLNKIRMYINRGIQDLTRMESAELITNRSKKFRLMGIYGHVTPSQIGESPVPRFGSYTPTPTNTYKVAPTPTPSIVSTQQGDVNGLLKMISDITVNSNMSLRKKPIPGDCLDIKDMEVKEPILRSKENTAKYILDKEGPEALVEWLNKQKKVMITDTTMRDAQQSLIATRVRTKDLMSVAEKTAVELQNAFSLEMWGGATFDVCISFLKECPWDRLRMLRKKIPNICFQMLIRGKNGVGYTNYPENVIKEFVKCAAKNGIDIFRIFDCFNDIENMKTCINTVRECKKVAQVCICFTGDFTNPNEKIYTLEYYKKVAKDITEAGAHMIAIKDMAGLFKPQMAVPFIKTIREVSNLPIQFHTHNTSGTMIHTLMALIEAGVTGVDVCLPSMSDCTSQPSLSALLAILEGNERHPDIDFRKLEELDVQWGNIRNLYYQYESGMKSGTTRVYENQIPGGQYSNLRAQCKALGLWDKWSEVLNMYRDVNTLLGDIIKVTPSSKVVGDFALFLINKGLTTKDVLDPNIRIEFPESVIGLVLGNLGKPHMGLPKEFIDKVMNSLNSKQKTNKNNNKLPDADLQQAKIFLQEKYKQEFKQEDILTYLLYPQNYENYLTYLKENGGKLIPFLPSIVFLYGMNVNQTIKIDTKDSLIPFDETTIKLIRVGPSNNNDIKTIVFQVNGYRHDVKVIERQEGKCVLQAADPKNPTHIPCPLSGTVGQVFVTQGDEITKGTPLMTIEAMKMKITVGAPYDGIVTKVTAGTNDRVENGTLLVILTPSK